MAEMENQRRRHEKEKNEAFEYGGFNLAAESLSLIDNIDRAIVSFKNDESLKNNKDLSKIIDGIEIVKKDLVSIFKKNGITPIECINKNHDLKKTIKEHFPDISLVTADPRHYSEDNGRDELQRCSIKGSRYSGIDLYLSTNMLPFVPNNYAIIYQKLKNNSAIICPKSNNNYANKFQIKL